MTIVVELVIGFPIGKRGTIVPLLDDERGQGIGFGYKDWQG